MTDIDVLAVASPTSSERRNRFTSTTKCCTISTIGKRVSDSQCYIKKKLNVNFIRRFISNLRRTPSSPVRHVESTQTIVTNLESSRPNSPGSWLWGSDPITGLRIVESSATIVTEVDIEASEEIIEVTQSEHLSGNDVQETGKFADRNLSDGSAKKKNVICKLCLDDVLAADMLELETCKCVYCIECLSQYVSLSVGSGYCEISCPDGDCPAESGALTDKEIDSLINKEKVELLAKLRVNLEVERDPSRIWCPNAGCETICEIPQDASPLRPVDKWNNPIVHIQCKTCAHDFCSSCKESWHENSGCEEDPLNERQGLVKRCPFCKVPIERDSGCAQMMCRRCKHVFCWYCLVSLDEDFMLRHYDKGPCRDKLGHTKLSLLWHRLQVVAVFLGCGIFFIIVSPVVVLVAPCVYVSRRRKKKNKSGDSDENEEAKRSRYFF
ncbi:probable E3 ubiquitin-protein ligase RNF144A-A [Artemia franciscana]|uniref:probable E3 ubiquitin-protein ligase RNF144A-A n=1 Tax=Artemia franciscana TaxID=6661 RepID=UPI0032D9B22F